MDGGKNSERKEGRKEDVTSSTLPLQAELRCVNGRSLCLGLIKLSRNRLPLTGSTGTLSQVPTGARKGNQKTL